MDAIPHLVLPLRIEGSGYAVAEQESLDEVSTAVAVICSFPIGSRIEAPEFGVPEYELSDRPLPTSGIETAVETWETRANVEVSEAPYDSGDPLAARLVVRVSVPDSEEI